MVQLRQPLMQQVKTLLREDEYLSFEASNFRVPREGMNTHAVIQFGSEDLANLLNEGSGGCYVHKSHRRRPSQFGEHPLTDDVRLTCGCRRRYTHSVIGGSELPERLLKGIDVDNVAARQRYR